MVYQKAAEYLCGDCGAMMTWRLQPALPDSRWGELVCECGAVCRVWLEPALAEGLAESRNRKTVPETLRAYTSTTTAGKT